MRSSVAPRSGRLSVEHGAEDSALLHQRDRHRRQQLRGAADGRPHPGLTPGQSDERCPIGGVAGGHGGAAGRGGEGRAVGQLPRPAEELLPQRV